MAEQLEFAPGLTLLGLQRLLRNNEGWFGGLAALGFKRSPDATLANYPGGNAPKPVTGLVLRNAATGQTATGPQGGTLICSGTVFISGNLQDVSAFRLP